MEVVADQPALETDAVELREQAKAWYAIRYESIVDAVESILLK